MADDPSIVVSKAISQEDYEFVTRICIEEKWCLGLNSVNHVGPVMKPGFLVGYLNGERVGCISLNKYGEGYGGGFGFIGFYYMAPSLRGNGYGWQLSKAVLELAGKEWNLALESGVRMAPKYEDRFIGPSQKSLQKEYTISCSKVIQAVQPHLSDYKKDSRIVPLDEVDFDKLSAYDASVFGFSRHDYLKQWVTIPASTCLVAISNSNTITGYGLIQPCMVNPKEQVIGPLFSDNTSTTQSLLVALAEAATNQKPALFDTLRLTVPVEANPVAGELVEKEIGYITVLDKICMYNKGMPPQIQMEKVVSITSPGFG